MTLVIQIVGCDDVNVVCLTRDKNFDRGKSVHSVRITLDGELMSSSLRNAKIHPYNYYEEGEYPKKSVNLKKECTIPTFIH